MILSRAMMHFLETGELGALRAGQTPEQVVSLLGLPEDTTDRCRRDVMWKYGSLQLGFCSRVLELICLYFFPTPVKFPPAIELSAGVPEATMSETQLIEAVRGAGINVIRDQLLTFGDQAAWKTTGATIIFDIPTGRVDKICSNSARDRS